MLFLILMDDLRTGSDWIAWTLLLGLAAYLFRAPMITLAVPSMRRPPRSNHRLENPTGANQRTASHGTG